MSDLDARVAALEFDLYCKDFRLRLGCDPSAYDVWIELQKPALHEPIPADVQESLKWLDRLCTEGMYRDRLDALRNYINANGLLQGRAKPVQEEITDAESKKWLLRSAKAEALLRRVHRLMPIFEKGVGQLTFTAETGGEVYAEMRAIQLELSGHTEESWAEAVIRASKGEKT